MNKTPTGQCFCNEVNKACRCSWSCVTLHLSPVMQPCWTTRQINIKLSARPPLQTLLCALIMLSFRFGRLPSFRCAIVGQQRIYFINQLWQPTSYDSMKRITVIWYSFYRASNEFDRHPKLRVFKAYCLVKCLKKIISWSEFQPGGI